MVPWDYIQQDYLIDDDEQQHYKHFDDDIEGRNLTRMMSTQVVDDFE
jgi:hypothetical protein